MYFVFDDKMVNYQRTGIWLKFSQLTKMWFYIPYKISKHSLMY